MSNTATLRTPHAFDFNGAVHNPLIQADIVAGGRAMEIRVLRALDATSFAVKAISGERYVLDTEDLTLTDGSLSSHRITKIVGEMLWDRARLAQRLHSGAAAVQNGTRV